jgi:GMP synthase-like glutamine amidotransferase
MTSDASLKIAIFLNGYISPDTPAIQSSFISALSSASSSSPTSSKHPPIIDFYDPIVDQSYPDQSGYDLIVLSGGTEDPSGSVPWVVKIRKFVRETVEEFPKKKIVGVCWGHQAICVAFGGTVGAMEGAELGVTRVGLTAKGKQIFPFASGGKVHIHEFHRREIKVPAEGFVALAEDNQMFVNERNTVLTLQGHPEMNAELAKSLLARSPTYMGVDEGKKEDVAKEMEVGHDGVAIWMRILEWVKE